MCHYELKPSKAGSSVSSVKLVLRPVHGSDKMALRARRFMVRGKAMAIVVYILYIAMEYRGGFR